MGRRGSEYEVSHKRFKDRGFDKGVWFCDVLWNVFGWVKDIDV